jgi:hypothetical protein
MPWLRSGTVSCTQNSNTVTGTNTGFAANARVGDAFLGPDGRWYEVANVASDTVLSILPGYQGAAVSAGAYALAPMQGYVKDSADALRALVNKFGSLAAAPSINALAALTGAAGKFPYYAAADRMALASLSDYAKSGVNGDITALSGLNTAIALNQGGTGGRSAAEAVSNLGLLNNSIRARFITSMLASQQLNSVSPQGLYAGWNGSNGQGEGNFICNKGAGTGGFSWRTVNNDNTLSGPEMFYRYGGNLEVPGTVTQGSDRRLKINDFEITDGLERIMQVRPVVYDRKIMLESGDYESHEAGMIAQELFESIPIAVSPGDDSAHSEIDQIWKVNYMAVIPYLVSAIKALKSEVDELREMLNASKHQSDS